jgi:lipopolysaccharide/colanic/teichoic acid biosynthesis glycosyltransferase
MFKRIFDIVFSAIGVSVLFLPCLFIAFLVCIDSRGPIFFRQQRVGKDAKIFRIIKFRTMIVQSELPGLSITVASDSRITRFGKYLRKYKIDEFPQLLNVLLGDMSFVGPRPEVPKYVQLYTEEQRQILKVKPGITDAASLKYRDESSLFEGMANPEEYYKTVILPDKIRLSLDYSMKSNILKASTNPKLVLRMSDRRLSRNPRLRFSSFQKFHLGIDRPLVIGSTPPNPAINFDRLRTTGYST